VRVRVPHSALLDVSLSLGMDGKELDAQHDERP